MNVENCLGRHDPAFDLPVRNDRITGDRYFSSDWMKLEWQLLWPRIWHVGGMMTDLEEPGDYITHALGRHLVVMIRQGDGSVRGFFNSCAYRGNRLVWSDIGGGERITCITAGSMAMMARLCTRRMRRISLAAIRAAGWGWWSWHARAGAALFGSTWIAIARIC